MKKILLLLAMAAMLFACQKENNEPVAGDQEVSFSATLVQPNLKNSDDIIPCKADVPTNAHIVINGLPYDPALFTLDGKLYTQAIKLAAGNYTITEFFLYKENNATPGYQNPGDIVVYATPVAGTHYASYVAHPMDYPFTVQAFKKIELDIEVLCFQDNLYQNFGFFWFDITEIVIREACFFGDLCIQDLVLWNVNPYNIGGVFVDEEAYIKVVVKKNGTEVPYSPFNNLSIYGTGAPLCVEYPDNLMVAGEVFTFELQVWQPVSLFPTVWNWQTYAVFTTTDAAPLTEAGTDGVIDFAVGTCSPNSFPIYAWIPPVFPDFFAFYIRNNNSTIVPPWDTDMNITENTEGDGFSCTTPRSGQKVGYGTHMFDGMPINQFETVNYNKLAGVPGIYAYLNFWVTDGTHYAIIASENMYLGTDFQTRQEWKVFEYDAGAGLDWFFSSGTGTRVNQYLQRNGVNVTLADFADNIVLADPGAPYPAYVGTGAPRGGYGFNIIFGDTQANFIQGPFNFNDLAVTVNGTTYLATNP